MPDDEKVRIEAEEPDCEEVAGGSEREAATADDDPWVLPDEERRVIDSLTESGEIDTSELEVILAGCLGARGGGWGGSEAPARRAEAIGVRNGLRVTGRKRSWGSAGSDHHVSQRASFAVDLSNGSSPTPEMDRTARAIASLCGVRNWGYGVLCRVVNGYRVQLLYRTNVGGNHYNHVHVGVRVGGRC